MAFDPALVPDNKKLNIELDTSGISSELVDFPLAVHLNGANSLHQALFDELGVSSKKIDITQNDVQCPVEIEYWDSVNKKAALHIKIPTTASDLVFHYDSTQDDNVEYIGETGATPTTDTTFSRSLTSGAGGGWQRTIRNIIPASALSTSGDQIRIAFKATAGTHDIGAVYIGESANTNSGYDIVPGTIKQITWDGGNTSKSYSGTVYSDWIDFDLDEAKDYVVSFSITDNDSGKAYVGGYTGYVARSTATLYIPEQETLDWAVEGWSETEYWICVTSIETKTIPPSMKIWDENYVAVYHMAQDPSVSSLLDSTNNGNDGIFNGSMTSGDLVDGSTGKAIEFDGVDDYILTDANDSALDITEEITLSSVELPKI
jgi:hypothetical protein